MVYSDLTRLAMQIAVRAHDGQMDRCGFPYIHHPLHVAESMETEESAAAALLHDVVEDTAWTLEDLAEAGIPAPVLEAVRLLTHDDETPYLDYVRQLKGNPIARAVKLSDLRHNSDVTRMRDPGPKDFARLEKYRKAKEILEEACPEESLR